MIPDGWHERRRQRNIAIFAARLAERSTAMNTNLDNMTPAQFGQWLNSGTADPRTWTRQRWHDEPIRYCGTCSTRLKPHEDECCDTCVYLDED